MNRSEILQEVRKTYLSDRVSRVDADYLSFEEDNTELDDLRRMLQCVDNVFFNKNPHNSILLYVAGLTDVFDFRLGRAYTVGGAPPDIDLDFEALGRPRVVDMLVDWWGRDNVANISTVGTFKSKSLTRRFFKLSSPPEEDHEATKAHYDRRNEILKMIPDPVSGFEPTMHDIIHGNVARGWEPHPELLKPKYADWFEFCSQLEGMVAQTGVHPAGVVLSNQKIRETVPCFITGDYENVTQFDMKEVEGQGLIKFDLLVINNGDIIKQACKLINERHGYEIDFNDLMGIPDGDRKAYSLFQEGMVAGIFQVETSNLVRDSMRSAGVQSVNDVADITAIVRPGPLQAGFVDRYLNRDPDPQLPEKVRELWGETRGVLVYQEQLMDLFRVFCNYSLQEADDIRRIVGKKKPEQLAKVGPEFKRRFMQYGGFSQTEADYLWGWVDDEGDKHGVIMGCADYLFNRAHAVCYSAITYACAWLKAHFPTEFFTALMSVRSKVMPPKDWAGKASSYVQEATDLGVSIRPPSVQHSNIGFNIIDNDVYFGLSGIKSVGLTASKCIMSARSKTPFADIYDFIERVNTSKVSTKTFQSLVRAGAFDMMGYSRTELLEHTSALYDFKKDGAAYRERLLDIKERDAHNAMAIEIVERRNELKKIQSRKRDRDLTPDELKWLEDHKDIRKKPVLKEKPVAVRPELTRSKRVPVTIGQIIEQAEYIGCFLGQHPARMVFPDSEDIANVMAGVKGRVAGQVVKIKKIVTRASRKPMCFLEINDGTGTAEIVVFPRAYAKLAANDRIPDVGDLVQVKGEVESEAPMIKLLAQHINIY